MGVGSRTGTVLFHQFSVKQPDLNWENPEGEKRAL